MATQDRYSDGYEDVNSNIRRKRRIDIDDELLTKSSVDNDAAMTAASTTNPPSQAAVIDYVATNATSVIEAAWTPVVRGESVAGVGTYSTQVGRTNRNGNVINIQGCIAWSTHTGSGTCQVVLPFAGRTGLTQRIPINWTGQGLGSVEQVYLEITAGSTTATMYYVSNSGTPATQALATSGTNFISIQGIYFAEAE